ncbi:hypothetical protein AVEN_60375-1 [Araneus ventricosus]|uniref:Uncharacterized protein n=1 Tax=Araneus ventricosus TaxID=182803 RepID=A0A4Y2H1S9_ARAVE|nr:hypothetical protein AVEN_60375-1 [Araneus ventricosus]
MELYLCAIFTYIFPKSFSASSLSGRSTSDQIFTVKQAIHISSKIEFLEHGKEKAIVSFKNRWKMAWRNGNPGIQTNSKSSTSCDDSNLEPRLESSDTLKDLPTLRPHTEGRNEARNLPLRGRGGGRILRL